MNSLRAASRGIGLIVNVWRPAGRTCSQRLTYDPAVPTAAPFASYLDGHLAVTPFGSVWKPFGDKRPCRVTSASSLNVSGTIPVYVTSTISAPGWLVRGGSF